MFKNNIKVALNNFKKYKTHSLINLAGLALGIACFILMFLWFKYELSYDNYHTSANQIYRLTTEMKSAGQPGVEWATTSNPVVPIMLQEYPKIVAAARILPVEFGDGKILIQYQNNRFYEKQLYFADSSLFRIFTIPLLSGDPKTALQAPFSIVITEEIAQKYFNHTDVLGKVLTINNQADLTITGVVKNIPQNSHFRFDFLISYATTELSFGPDFKTEWGNFNLYSYLLLSTNTSPVLKLKSGVHCLYAMHI